MAKSVVCSDARSSPHGVGSEPIAIDERVEDGAEIGSHGRRHGLLQSVQTKRATHNCRNANHNLYCGGKKKNWGEREGCQDRSIIQSFNLLVS